MAELGDAKLTDLLVTLLDCEKARSFSVYDRCKARYEGLQLDQRRLPLRRQELPLRVHDQGHVPLGGKGIASWAASRGTQDDPDLV
jgi:hypothetical protein